MGKIILEDIEIYAYHGHLQEENEIGGRFLVNLEIDIAFEDACTSDNLEDTFDYQVVFNIVKEEMAVKSSLLEHVASRILVRILEASKLVWSAKIKISKMNPPLGGDVKAVSVEIKKERDQ
jgi:7,8-dihydroneopterin aldolase/epimerase/oxygenase